MRKSKAKPAAVPVAPEAPPKLVKMGAMKAGHEAVREEEFPKWKAALEAADGNVTEAGIAMRPDLDRKKARLAAQNQVRRLGLQAFAASLRLKATGKSGPGRPRK